MINITNWLLTRRCNLNCSYCSIIKDYENKPKEYPDINHYNNNEMSVDNIIKTIEKIQLNNPNCFHIFFGGEPLLRNDLFDIIKYCNDHNVEYTIISNSSPQTIGNLDLILSKTFIKSFTTSVDPLIFLNYNNDEYKKSKYGFDNLLKMKNHIKDTVAEVTISNSNIGQVYNTVELLTNNNITSNINFVDIKKNNYYDFSNVLVGDNNIVNNDLLLRKIFTAMFNDNFKIHLGKKYIDKILSILPYNFDCQLEKDFYDLTIDADGSIRLCLRIRGVITPKIMNINNFINEKGKIDSKLLNYIKDDKLKYCRMCGWTGIIMSTMMYHDNKISLVHKG